MKTAVQVKKACVYANSGREEAQVNAPATLRRLSGEREWKEFASKHL